MVNLKKSIDLLFSPKYLLYTNVALGGTFLGAGDFIEQYLNRKFLHQFSKSNDDKVKEKLKIKTLETDLNRVCKFVIKF